MLNLRIFCFIAGLITLTVSGYCQIRVVNMIPKELSQEKYNNAEPSLAVNPANPNLIAGTAFTPAPMGGSCAPIFVSETGGTSWWLNPIVPGAYTGSGNHPALLDITIGFSSSGLQLYIASLRGDVTTGSTFPEFEVRRTPKFTTLGLSADLMNKRINVDHPHVEVMTVMGGGSESTKDKVYVGVNDKFRIPPGDIGMVDIFDKGQGSPLPLIPTLEIVDKRNNPPNRKNEPPIKTAVHGSGVVYVAFYRIKVLGTEDGEVPDKVDIVVVRDDNWGNGPNRFQALKDINGEVGIVVQADKFIKYGGLMGINRLIASSLSIAVDPTNSATVYLCWADNSGSPNTLHVWKSTNSGHGWNPTGLVNIEKAINPALAVNMKGKVGFMYQQLDATDSIWETHFRRSENLGDSWDDAILSRARCLCTFRERLKCPEESNGLYLGDYIHLKAVGKDFYGVFSASNQPDRDNFPSSNAPNELVYQRNADFTPGVNKLTDIDGNPVRASIDPFFFHVSELDEIEDFYVRDFTNDLTDFDKGIEPSIEPRFCITSDVWNRQSSAPGSFTAENQPEDEKVLGWLAGSNFIFTRVHRKLPGEAKDVTLNFYKSEFGTGSNYEPVGTQNLSFPANASSAISLGFEWKMSSNTSSHSCIAVEVSTAVDPILSPSLFNKTPGWDTGTDLMVINDNNKAQKNLQVLNISLPPLSPPPTNAANNDIESVTAYAVIHNPSLKAENVNILWYVDSALKSKVYPTLSVPGSQDRNVPSKQGMTLYNMQPGESRFLKIDYRIIDGKEGERYEVPFSHIRNEIIVNGFSVEQAFVPMEKAIKQYAQMENSVLGRAQSLYPKLDNLGFKELQLSQEQVKDMTTANYTNRLNKSLSLFKSIANHLRSVSGGDPFELAEAINQVDQSLKANDLRSTTIAHLSLINTLDAYLTMLQFKIGNKADILQTIYLQRQIMDELKSKNDQITQLRDLSIEFINRFEKREIDINSYSSRVNQMLPLLKTISPSSEELKLLLTNIEKNIADPVALQGAHIKYLLKLREINK